jgi:hypothetical protein
MSVDPVMVMRKTETDRSFVSEPITPVVATADPKAMAAGGPGLPREFGWRNGTLSIAAVLRTWRETGPCSHGSAEAYVRKHWFEVELTSGQRARIYFERQPRGGNRTHRWWLFSVEEEKDTGSRHRAHSPL